MRAIASLARAVIQVLINRPSFRGQQRIIVMLMRLTPFVRSVYGPVVVSDPQDYTNRACILGHYGKELSDLILALPPNATFLDFGANVGLFSLIAERHLTLGRVFSFEPSRSTFAKLVRNMELNQSKRVVAFNFGISAKSQLVRFSVSEIHSGGGHISDDGTDSILLLGANVLSDVVVPDDQSMCLCKIDTEGSELVTVMALAGCGLLNKIQMLHIGVDDKNLVRMGGSEEALYTFLAAHGFAAQTTRRGQPHYDEIFERR